MHTTTAFQPRSRQAAFGNMYPDSQHAHLSIRRAASCCECMLQVASLLQVQAVTHSMKRKRRPKWSASQKEMYVEKWLHRPTMTVAIRASCWLPCVAPGGRSVSKSSWLVQQERHNGQGFQACHVTAKKRREGRTPRERKSCGA